MMRAILRAVGTERDRLALARRIAAIDWSGVQAVTQPDRVRAAARQLGCPWRVLLVRLAEQPDLRAWVLAGEIVEELEAAA